MLNMIWAVMILLAVIYGALAGNMSEVTNAALDSAGEAISLCLTMAGVVALWMGLMEIAGKAGLIQKLTKGIMPFLRFMFPRLPPGHPAGEYIATNIIANVLGLGWACTPAGLKAMEELAKLEAQRGTAEYIEESGKGGQQSNSGLRKRGEAAAAYDSTGRNAAGRGRTGSGMERGGGRKSDVRGASGERRASNEMCTFLILNISSLQLIPVNMIAYRSQYGSVNPAGIIAPAIAATAVSTAVAIVFCKVMDRRRRI